MVIFAAAPDTWEVISVVAAVVAIALAGFAIWQASMFYRWSNQASQDVKRSSDAMGESVRKLEDLFNRLYSDTFGMMRDTVSDMRKHMWPSEPTDEALTSDLVKEIEKRTDEHVAAVRQDVRGELRGLAERIGATASQVSELEDSFGHVLDRAISGSREAEGEAIQETIRGRLERSISSYRRGGRTEVSARELLDPLFIEFSPEDVHGALVALKRDGAVDWSESGPGGWVEGPNIPITFRPRRITRRPRSQGAARLGPAGDDDGT
jgi:hypothetical protein